MKNLVIFDLDGTLIYSLKQIRYAVNFLLKKHNYKQISLDQTRNYVGYGAKYLVSKASNETGEMLEVLYKDYLEIFKNLGNDLSTLYDGVDELLINLKQNGYKIAIVTNKPNSVTKVVEKDLLKKYNFDFVLGLDISNKAKPDSSMVEKCLKELNTSRENAVYVGDSEVDVLTAKNSGIVGISVLWGYRDKQVLENSGAKYFAKNTKELYKIIIDL